MDKNLFDNLFNRPTENHDYLRARVASVIEEISEGLLQNLKGNYNDAFYIAVNNYCNKTEKKFGKLFFKELYYELNEFKTFLFEMFNSNTSYKKISELLSENKLEKYELFSNYCGYAKRSRILRRYKNLQKITKSFLKGKISHKDYKDEILNHIIFFDDMIKNLKNTETWENLQIYLFVYDIRASQKVREKV